MTAPITYKPISPTRLSASCSACGWWFGDKAADGNTYTDDYGIALNYQRHVCRMSAEDETIHALATDQYCEQ